MENGRSAGKGLSLGIAEDRHPFAGKIEYAIAAGFVKRCCHQLPHRHCYEGNLLLRQVLADTKNTVNEELKLAARTNSSAMAQTRFEWDFGDNKRLVVMNNSVATRA